MIFPSYYHKTFKIHLSMTMWYFFVFQSIILHHQQIALIMQKNCSPEVYINFMWIEFIHEIHKTISVSIYRYSKFIQTKALQNDIILFLFGNDVTNHWTISLLNTLIFTILILIGTWYMLICACYWHLNYILLNTFVCYIWCEN